MMPYPSLWNGIVLLSAMSLANGSPTQGDFSFISRYFDVQGHRGSRGEAIENTLPAFAWGLIDGVTTLELDNGITKDGHVIVWHDEEITPEKCQDTQPVADGDPDFPYVGKHIANLTLAQLKTLDCGSKRQMHHPLQLTYPGTKISTLDELFKFAHCADPERVIQWNIESKINAANPNSTRGVQDFVTLQHQAFLHSGYKLSQITYQSFDWRTLVSMKAVEPRIRTSALIDDETLYGPGHSVSEWHAGLSVESFPGETIGQKIANTAHAIGASILSPAAVASGIDPEEQTYTPFTTWEMIQEAHKNGLLVKPWTVNRFNIAHQLLDWGVDGLISDYPTQMRRLIQQVGKPVAPKFPKKRVLDCLGRHVEGLLEYNSI